MLWFRFLKSPCPCVSARCRSIVAANPESRQQSIGRANPFLSSRNLRDAHQQISQTNVLAVLGQQCRDLSPVVGLVIEKMQQQ